MESNLNEIHKLIPFSILLIRVTACCRDNWIGWVSALGDANHWRAAMPREQVQGPSLLDGDTRPSRGAEGRIRALSVLM